MTPGTEIPDLKSTRFAGGKDVYVFEHCEDIKRITTRVPRFEHSTSLYITNAWTDYVVKMAENYEDPRPAPALMKEGVSEASIFSCPATRPSLGMLLTENRNGPVRLFHLPTCGKEGGLSPLLLVVYPSSARRLEGSPLPRLWRLQRHQHPAGWGRKSQAADEQGPHPMGGNSQSLNPGFRYSLTFNP